MPTNNILHWYCTRSRKFYQLKLPFNREFEGVETIYKNMGVLSVNDEAIMFDVIINELAKDNELYAKVRL